MSGIQNFVSHKTLSYSAGGTSSLTLDFLPKSIEGLVNHLRAIVIVLKAALTPDASTGDNGEDITGGVIEEIRVKDHLGNLVVRLKGYQLRSAERFFTQRQVYADPADVTAGGSASTWYSYHRLAFGDASVLPFLGGDDDALHPVARYNEGSAVVEVVWKSTPSINAAVGSSTEVQVHFELEALPTLMAGADVRMIGVQSSDPTNLKLPAPGRLAMAALVDSSRSFSAISEITIPQHQIAQPCAPADLVAATAARMGQYDTKQNPQAPDFVPLTLPAPGGKLTMGTIHPQGGSLAVDVTTTGSSVAAIIARVDRASDLRDGMAPVYAATYGVRGEERVEMSNKRPPAERLAVLEGYGARKVR